MKVNIYYDENGISILDLLSEDFLSFLQEYISKNIS